MGRRHRPQAATKTIPGKITIYAETIKHTRPLLEYRSWNPGRIMRFDAPSLLIAQVTCNPRHLLHDLLPPLRKQHYYASQLQLPTLNDKNFLIRMSYKASN